jgi:hypothetical protein
MTPLCRHLMQHMLHAYSLFGPLQNLLRIIFWPSHGRKWDKMAILGFFWPNGLPLDDATLQAFDAGHAPCIQPLWTSSKSAGVHFWAKPPPKMGQNGHFGLDCAIKPQPIAPGHFRSKKP